MSACPVVQIVHDNPEGFCEINESDFDPAKGHVLYKPGAEMSADEPVEEAKRRGRPPKAKE